MSSPISTAATEPAITAASKRRSSACRVAAATSAGVTRAKPPAALDRACTNRSFPPTVVLPDTDCPPTARLAPTSRAARSADRGDPVSFPSGPIVSTAMPWSARMAEIGASAAPGDGSAASCTATRSA